MSNQIVQRKGGGSPAGRLPMIGSIKKGDPKEANRPGADLDHFRPDFKKAADLGLDADWLMQCWRQLYGNEPRRIDHVRFALPNVDDVMSSRYEVWGNKGKAPVATLVCDGERVRLDLKMKDNPRAGRTCDALASGSCSCQLAVRLNIVLPEFSVQSGAFGMMTVLSHSINDFQNLYGSLSMAASASPTGLYGLDFSLSRVLTNLVTPQGIPIQKWLLAITPMPASVMALGGGTGNHQSALPTPAQALPAPTASFTETITLTGKVTVFQGRSSVGWMCETVEGVSAVTNDAAIVAALFGDEVAGAAVGEEFVVPIPRRAIVCERAGNYWIIVNVEEN